MSPCTGICKIGEHGYCIGCWRSLEEIASWRDLSKLELKWVQEQQKWRKRAFSAPLEVSICLH